MNLWKPTALALATAFGVLVGYGAASANPGDPQPGSRQWHMSNALEHLRFARAELLLAEHDREGWRERAVEATDRALWETRRAIDVWHP
jgi:hypothetical protein